MSLWSASLLRPFDLKSFNAVVELRKPLFAGKKIPSVRICETQSRCCRLEPRSPVVLSSALPSAGVNGDGRGDQAPLCAGGRVPDGLPPFSSSPQGLQERESLSSRCSVQGPPSFLVATEWRQHAVTDLAPAGLCQSPSARKMRPRPHSAFHGHLVGMGWPASGLLVLSSPEGTPDWGCRFSQLCHLVAGTAPPHRGRTGPKYVRPLLHGHHQLSANHAAGDDRSVPRGNSGPGL